MSKPKYEYVVVDGGTWGIGVQLSTKIVVKDHLNVKNGDACSLPGTDPVTKRPIMFEGEVLGVFGEYVCSLFDKQMLIYLFFFSWVRAVRSVLKFLLYICNPLACEPQTHFRSSLLSLRKIASANPSDKTISVT